MRWICCCLLLMLLGACTSLAAPVENRAPVVWSVDEKRFVSMDHLTQRVRESDVVLLGETHDNAQHHAIQNAILAASTRADASSVLVMEQYDLEQQENLDAILPSRQPVMVKLAALQALMRPGWSWPDYRQLLETAMRLQMPVVAANISRESLRLVSRNGFSALGTGEEQRLALDHHWSLAQQDQLAESISDGHCGMLPATAVAAISKAQRARDAIMADRILAASPRQAIAILGRGHVRKELAVPLYIKQRAPHKTLLSIALADVDAGQTPGAFATGPLGTLYDYVVFTGTTIRAEDPCKAMTAPK